MHIVTTIMVHVDRCETSFRMEFIFAFNSISKHVLQILYDLRVSLLWNVHDQWETEHYTKGQRSSNMTIWQRECSTFKINIQSGDREREKNRHAYWITLKCVAHSDAIQRIRLKTMSNHFCNKIPTFIFIPLSI